MSLSVEAPAELERHIRESGRALLLAAIDRAGDQFEHACVRERSVDFDGPDGTATVEWIRHHLGWWQRWMGEGCGWTEADGPADAEVRRWLKEAERDEQAYVVRRRSHAQVWGVTPDGDAWLAEWQAGHGGVELPESPAHRRWRVALAEACEEEQEVRQAVRDAAAELAAAAEATSITELPRDHFYLFDLKHLIDALAAEEPA